MLIPLLYGCGKKTDEAEKTTEYTEEKTDEGFNDTLRIDEKEIIIPGVQGEYEFVVVNDLHIIQLSDEYTDEKAKKLNNDIIHFEMLIEHFHQTHGWKS